MLTSGIPRHRLSIYFIVGMISMLVLSACQSANIPASLPPTPTLAATQAPAPATQTPSIPSGGIQLDLAGVAQNQTLETMPAVPASADTPYWQVTPEYRLITLQGYPVAGSLMKPQIFIYRVKDLTGLNEATGQMATDLKTLLESKKSVQNMPFLPLFNAAQVMHSQVQYLDFKNGKGVRFLTQFDQAPLPINNSELLYTFQGLTSDGQYYITAILPVTHPDLPATNRVDAQNPGDLADFPAYLTKTITWLEQQPGSRFTPDLRKLDAMMQSLEMK